MVTFRLSTSYMYRFVSVLGADIAHDEESTDRDETIVDSKVRVEENRGAGIARCPG